MVHFSVNCICIFAVCSKEKFQWFIGTMSDNATTFLVATVAYGTSWNTGPQKGSTIDSNPRSQVTLNPPLAPHFGHAHNIIIKLAMIVIYAVIWSAGVTDDEQNLQKLLSTSEPLPISKP